MTSYIIEVYGWPLFIYIYISQNTNTKIQKKNWKKKYQCDERVGQSVSQSVSQSLSWMLTSQFYTTFQTHLLFSGSSIRDSDSSLSVSLVFEFVDGNHGFLDLFVRRWYGEHWLLTLLWMMLLSEVTMDCVLSYSLMWLLLYVVSLEYMLSRPKCPNLVEVRGSWLCWCLIRYFPVLCCRLSATRWGPVPSSDCCHQLVRRGWCDQEFYNCRIQLCPLSTCYLVGDWFLSNVRGRSNAVTTVHHSYHTSGM